MAIQHEIEALIVKTPLHEYFKQVGIKPEVEKKEKEEDSCQEGENLVNRHLLQFMLHLAAHLLAQFAVSFSFLLQFCFAHVSMDYVLIKTWGQHPIVLQVSLSVTYLEILLMESLMQKSPAVLAASSYSHFLLFRISISEIPPRLQPPFILTMSAYCCQLV